MTSGKRDLRFFLKMLVEGAPQLPCGCRSFKADRFKVGRRNCALAAFCVISLGLWFWPLGRY